MAAASLAGCVRAGATQYGLFLYTLQFHPELCSTFAEIDIMWLNAGDDRLYGNRLGGWA